MSRRDLKLACVDSGPLPAPRRDVARHAPLLRALADEVRLEIVGRLAAAGRPVCVCDLMPGLGRGRPTVSHPLGFLGDAGIVGRERRGSWVYYSLDLAIIAQLADLIGALAPPAHVREADEREAS